MTNSIERPRMKKMLVALAGLIMLVSPLAARQPDRVPGEYIIELNAAPSLRFRGGEVSQLSASGRAVVKTLAATAPAVRDEVRFDVSRREVRQYTAYLDSERINVLDQAESWLGRSVEPRHIYRHVLNGFSARLSSEEARQLAGLAGVRRVIPVERRKLHNDHGHQWIGANRVWLPQFGTPVPNRGEGMVLGLIDSGINWDSVFFNDQPGGFQMTNPRGQFFGLCSDPTVACNNKIIGVYDFTDEDTKGKDINGHGSHVASSAVGSPLSFTVNLGTGLSIFFAPSGVAPRASVISYKACDQGDPDDPEDEGGCPSSALVAALEQAIVDQVDVINYSIGSTGPTAPSPWAGLGQFDTDTDSSLFLSVRSAGIVPVSSAGNSGPADGTVSSPANAPWVMAVANATHNRILGGRLENLSGGSGTPPQVTGAGITEGSAVVPIVYAGDFGNALCGTGQPELGPTCQDNTGASNPFPAGTFNGQIVICDRGEYGRVEKGRNLLAAGAGGMILVNQPGQGNDVTADEHCLPSLHVPSDSGQSLKSWLTNGSGHQGRIPASTRQVGVEFGGRLAVSSSRGPILGAPNLMKPNVTAPGTDILGAGAPDANAISFSTGTSMASPHVAGAALLLRHAFPAWSVDAVISALETTASADLVFTDAGEPARVIDGGAGGIQVDKAARAGLYLPVTEAEFLAANPAQGGDPGKLNLPGVVSDACAGSCDFHRTLKALAPSSWSVSLEGDLAIEVEPSSFSLQTGEEVTLSITISAGSVAPGQWGRGSIALVPSSSVLGPQRLPVGARMTLGSLPDLLAIEVSANQARGFLNLADILPLPEAMFLTSPLVRPEVESFTLVQDPTSVDPFSGGAGVKTWLVEVPENALALFAETVFSDAQDLDLFVGRDLNGNGQAEESEVVCASISPDELERCVINQPEAGTWWILVQNWLASGAPGGDESVLEFALLSDVHDMSFGVNGPGLHTGGPLEVQLFVDQPAMRENETWLTAIGISSTPDTLLDVGVIPVTVTRTEPNPIRSTALFKDQTRAVVLPPGGVHDRLFVDVPPGTQRLDIRVAGDANVTGTLHFAQFDSVAGSAPLTPPAAGAALASGSGSAAGFDLTRMAPDPGRYYVKLTNAAAAERRVDVTVELAETERHEPRFGLWSPRDRVTNQGIEWQRAGLGFMLWYSYDAKGLPVFYLAINEVDPSSSTWTASINRATGVGIRDNVDVVGEVTVTTIDSENLVMAWRLNGAHGSEIMTPIAPATCPEINGQPISYSGLWHSPGLAQGGTTVIVYDQGQFYVRYYYDADGVGRWVIAQATGPGPFADEFEVWSFKGFCPNCEPLTPTWEVVGTFEREFTSSTTGSEVLDFVSPAPINGDILLDVPTEKWSEPMPCP